MERISFPFFCYFKKEIKMSGAISLPADELGTSNLAQARAWFNHKWYGDNSENAPLLNRERGTVEPPKKTTFRIVVTIALSVIALVIIGVGAGFWFHAHEKRSCNKYILFSL